MSYKTIAVQVEPGERGQRALAVALQLAQTQDAHLIGVAGKQPIYIPTYAAAQVPPELFESAKMDGAGELRMFYQIAVPICRPIFAVIALDAFRRMYGAFMFALLVCQDKAKWTIMVFIYQSQQIPAVQPYTVMAALTLTAIPTLLVFLFVQREILRGIVIPHMK